MFNKRSLYLFLLSATVCSLILNYTIFFFILTISLIIVFILNRGILYTFRANKYLNKNNIKKGYPILKRAYKTNTVPYIVINGYIYLSLKLGLNEEAYEAIDRVLTGKVSCKIKDTHKREALTLKSLYLWKTGDLKAGIEILDDLYKDNYINTLFFGNYGYMLFLDGQIEKAEKVCLEAHDYGERDKVTLDNLVSIYISTNRWEDGKKYLEKLLELNPKFPEAYYHGAQISQHYGDLEKAYEMLEKSLTLEFTHMTSITRDDIVNLQKKLEEK